MVKAKERLRRRIGRWLPIAKGADRKNPDSIRRFLFDLITHDHGKDAAPLAAKINATKARIPENQLRRYHSVVNAEWLYQATRNNKYIHYGHLEVVARSIGVPTALLLAYTRIYSEQQSGETTKIHKSLRILHGLKAAIEKLILILQENSGNEGASTRPLTFSDFQNMRDAYQAEADLPLFAQKQE